LQWKHVHEDHVRVEQRLYKGQINTPKTARSRRQVALSPGTLVALAKWRKLRTDDSDTSWVFPTERGTPYWRDNMWRQRLLPRARGRRMPRQIWRPRAIIWLEPIHLCRSLIATSDRVPSRALLRSRRRHLRGNSWRPPDLSVRLFLIPIDLRYLWHSRRSPDDDRFARWITGWPARRARHHLGESAMSFADRQRRSCGDH
jgi:hypothetical protein